MADMKAPMPAEGAADRRRSHRVNIAMPILVRGTRGTQRFEEESLTVSVTRTAVTCVWRIPWPAVRKLHS